MRVNDAKTHDKNTERCACAWDAEIYISGKKGNHLLSLTLKMLALTVEMEASTQVLIKTMRLKLIHSNLRFSPAYPVALPHYLACSSNFTESNQFISSTVHE